MDYYEFEHTFSFLSKTLLNLHPVNFDIYSSKRIKYNLISSIDADYVM